MDALPIESTADYENRGVVLVAARDAQVTETLKGAHHELAIVDDGDALRRTLEDPALSAGVDVVVAEVDFDGRSVLDALARTAQNERPPIVLLSPRGTQELFARARRFGAFVVLHEPIVPEHLRSIVARLVRDVDA